MEDGAAPTMRSVCLAVAAAAAILAGCSPATSGNDAATAAEAWAAHFEVVDTLIVPDTALRRMLLRRDSIPTPEMAWRIDGLGSGAWMPSPTADREAADDFMGVVLDIDTVPYWPSWRLVHGARMGGMVFAASRFTYVIRIFGRTAQGPDSITAAPPSWRQPRPPEWGEFVDATDDDVRAYLRDFTYVTGLAAVSERVLVVAHGRYVDPAPGPPGVLARMVGGRHPGGTAAVSDHVNVYLDGERVVEDAPAPGEILGYGAGRVVFAKRTPESPAYTLTEYAWKRP